MVKKLSEVPFTTIQIGQVIYNLKTNKVFVITTLLASFPDMGTPEAHEIDYLGTEYVEDNMVLHCEATDFGLIDRILGEDEWKDYKSILAKIESSL